MLKIQKLTQKQFNLLPMQARAMIVCKHTYLVNMVLEEDEDISNICTLYSFRDYYIEVVVDNLTRHLINILAFRDNDERLDKYIERIDIQELFTN